MQPIPSDPPSDSLPTKRRRGGQPGNANRLIHGAYSKRLPRQLTAPPNPRTGFTPEFEIALARVHIGRLLVAQEKAPKKDYLSYERAIMNYLGVITSLMRSAARHRRRDRELLDIVESLEHLRDRLPFSEVGGSNPIRTS